MLFRSEALIGTLAGAGFIWLVAAAYKALRGVEGMGFGDVKLAGMIGAFLGPFHVLFTIFVFGPCEPLIPVLMYPAAEGSWWGVGVVAGVFGLATLATMLVTVALGHLGLSRLPLGGLERYSHALAGLALVACGLVIRIGP